MAIIQLLNRHKRIVGDVIDLVERYHLRKEDASDGVETIYYDMYLSDSLHRVGYIDFRMSAEGMMYYYGHVGYRVIEDERGHHYAYEACKVLFKEARDTYGFKELIITCSPDNIASFKTLQRLGGELVETVDVPREHELYRRNERVKAIFRYDLNELWKD